MEKLSKVKINHPTFYNKSPQRYKDAQKYWTAVINALKLVDQDAWFGILSLKTSNPEEEKSSPILGEENTDNCGKNLTNVCDHGESEGDPDLVESRIKVERY